MSAGITAQHQLPSPVAVAHRLIELGQLLDAATDELARLDEDYVQAKQKHQVAYARAFLTGVGSVDARKQAAVLECSELCMTMEIAEQLVRACRERIKTLRDQMEIARSVGAATRAEMAATHWTAGP